MKTLLTTLITATITFGGMTVYADDNRQAMVTQDAHGNARVLFTPCNAQPVSVALFAGGRGLSANRTNMSRNDAALGQQDTHQYGQSIIRN